MSKKPCPLCQSDKAAWSCSLQEKVYYCCSSCLLVYLDPGALLSKQEERSHYLTHENFRENEGYVQFLCSVIDPVCELRPPPGSVIDFGSGPGPVAADLLRERGYTVTCYDPYFANVPTVLKAGYDIVLCTEVVEHFHSPRDGFTTLDSLLENNGLLGLMTLIYESKAQFEDWWYPRDPTHCSFYHQRTLDFICEMYGFREVYSDNARVFVYEKR